MRVRPLFLLPLPFLLTGCALVETAPTAQPLPQHGAAIQGIVHGGQQPISGSHVYLFAANTTGYGNASVSLLNNVPGTSLDSSGGSTNGDYYVTTDTYGSFSISGDYTCTANTQVYLYALGGNAGSGTAASIGLLAILGNCPSTGNFLTATPYVVVNEVSTVAAAYSFAGFAVDATHVSSSGTALAQTGIANAFATSGNLATLATGTALAATPSTANGGSGVAPQTTVNTLANILASCINSSGAVTGPTNPTACYTLFTNAKSSGSSGTEPTDTATAAINMAHNPGVNITTLYSLVSPSPPFAPALTAQPNDFTLSLYFTGGGLYNNVSVQDIAIDGSGNVWVATSNYISEFSNTGVALSPPVTCNSSYCSPGGFCPPVGLFCSYLAIGTVAIAIDLSGNAWVTDSNGIAKYSAAGTPLSPENVTGFCGTYSDGFYGGGLGTYTSCTDQDLAYYQPSAVALAVDASNHIWTGNNEQGSGGGSFGPGSVSEFTNAGVPLSPSTGGSAANGYSTNGNGGFGTGYGGYTGGGLAGPYAVAIDGSGNAWIASHSIGGVNGALAEYSSSGAVLSPSTGYQSGNISQQGYENSSGLAIDASGNIWIANGAGVLKLSNSGVLLSSSTGYTGGGSNGDTSSLALDGAGNVWAMNTGNTYIEYSNSGTAISPSTGYKASFGTLLGGYTTNALAIDGSGNVWGASQTYNGGMGLIIEFVGAATPVITPIAAGLPATPTSNGSSNLGTRP